MNIKGKTALITGGAVRVGRAITLGLAKAGANVIINYSSSADMAVQTAKEAEKLGVSAFPIQANVADWEQVKAMFEQIHQQLGKIDILVNNASPFKATPDSNKFN